MFQRILSFIRDWINKMLSTSNVKQALKIDVAISSTMATALELWMNIYNNQAGWLSADVQSLNLGAAIASELARAVTIEMKAEVSGSARGDFLNEQLKQVINTIRTNTEYCVAKGGLWFKPYIKGGQIAIDYVQADQGYPVAFDANQNMTAAVFADQRVIKGKYYTRLEFHQLTGPGYQIINSAWVSDDKNSLGRQIPLTEVDDWAELEEQALILNVDKPLFAYFKMPFANNIDVTSPLGVSIFSRAAQSASGKCLLQQADELWSNFLWELESAKRALYVDPTALEKNSTTSNPQLGAKRLYRTLSMSSGVDEEFFKEWSPTIREVNILNSLDAVLRRIEFNCGLSYGILSNPESQALTATEIVNSKQRYYSNVVDVQKSLQAALENLLYAMDVWVTLGNLAPRGTYTAVFDFSDSVVADDALQFTQDQQAVTMNAMPKVEFLKRNYKLDDATAADWVARAKAENPAPSFFPQDSLGA